MYSIKAIETIKRHLTDHQETICLAESVTSGHLQAALSLANEASKFFQGGITAYNLGQKARHLRVNPIHAATCNSVSERIADEMALNALRLFSSDWAVGITGYATTVPDLGINHLFAFYAVAYRKKVLHRGKIESDDLGALNVQVHFTNKVLAELSALLEKRDHEPFAAKARENSLR